METLSRSHWWFFTTESKVTSLKLKCSLLRSSKAIKASLSFKTSQELGNCPIGQREALLKDRIYWKKGFIKEEKNWSKFGNFNKIWKFCWNCEIWSKLWNLVKIVKFGQNREIWSNSWNLAKVGRSGRFVLVWSGRL